MSNNKSKNDSAWEKIFEKRKILDDIDKNGIHQISSKEINQYREARLMTKFDHRVNLPLIFKKNELAILPSTRGSYLIGSFECYKNVTDPNSELIDIAFARDFETLSPDNLYSESVALLCAYQSGIIENFLEEGKFDFTIFGRMSTGAFDYSIKAKSKDGIFNQRLSVNRAQIEIDGGFESSQSFAIFEVKNQEVEDFHIRQLYFPYRLWENKISKNVCPIFTTYSNEVFTLSMYEFEELNDYSSIQLVKRKRYRLVPTSINIDNIRQILANTEIQPEPDNIPFPQADRIERVIDLLGQLRIAEGGSLTKEEITSNYAFDTRQTQYYSGAALYLGLVNRENQNGTLYTLTELGNEIMTKAPIARNLTLIELIVSRYVFRKSLELYLDKASPPPISEIVGFMDEVGLNINETTRNRRSQSVLSWIQWIMQLTVE